MYLGERLIHKKVLFFLIAGFLLTLWSLGCGRIWGNVNGLGNLSGAAQLIFSGPVSIGASSCRPFSVITEDSNGNPFNVLSGVIFTLNGAGAGSFYSDPGCTSSTISATIAAGTSSQTVYYKSGLAQTLTMSANVQSIFSNSLGVAVSAGAPAWVSIAPVSTPTKLAQTKMVYHSKRKTAIVYGGITTGGGFAAEMWEYNPAVPTWTQICAGCGPGNRAGHGLAYDSARDRIVLFGSSGGGDSNDVWEWDESTWTNVSASIAGVAPSARNSLYMAYDSNRKRTVIFAGTHGGVDQNDVYEYDGVSWYGPFLPATKPSTRHDRAQLSTFDNVNNTFQIYAGGGNDDTWQWNGSTWLQLCGACTGAGRGGEFMVFAADRNFLVVAEGDNGAIINDSWTMDEGSFIWTAVGGNPAPIRTNGAMIYDSARARSVFFGGCNTAANCGGATFYNDTWEFGYP